MCSSHSAACLKTGRTAQAPSVRSSFGTPAPVEISLILASAPLLTLSSFVSWNASSNNRHVVEIPVPARR